jgi:ribosome recycling factor
MGKELLKSAEARMKGATDALEGSLGGIRTGRASPALVDRLQVEYYGTLTPLNQMATIAAPEPRLLTIRPWDLKAMATIEKAIMASDLGLTPASDGQVIRLPIPILTEERREALTKVAARRCEEARVEIRNIRRDLIHDLEHAELPEDELHDAKHAAQELTDRHIARVDELGHLKAAEIRET